MTKADLIESVAAKLDLPRARRSVPSTLVFDDIVEALRNGDKVNISGFGTFAVSDAQGAHRAQSEDGREHRDPRVEVGEVQSRQDAEGRAQVARTRPGG